MGLKFDCTECGKLIIAGFLLHYDELYCPHCENLIVVPRNASETNEPSTVLAIMKEKALIKDNSPTTSKTGKQSRSGSDQREKPDN